MKTDMIRNIMDIEWKMFQNVNGDERVGCQNDRETFEIMRGGQFSAWSEEVLASYLRDLEVARRDGRNLMREKYIHMMASTDPDGYAVLKSSLPEISGEKRELTDNIWAHLRLQTEEMREKYPFISLGGRPLYSNQEEGWPSVETYQKGELLTYSEETLRLLLQHLLQLEKRGIHLAFLIQERSVMGLGYASMDDAEKAMAKALERCGCIS